MPSTLVHASLPTLCLWVSRKSFPHLSVTQLFKLLFIACILGNACDLDIIPAMLFPSHWGDIHREWGHNLFSITLWICLGRWAFTRFVSKDFEGRRGWLLAMALVSSHVFLDAAGDYSPESMSRCGVPLLWPLSKWEFLLPYPLFSSYRLGHADHPLAAHIVSLDFWTRAIFSEVLTTLILLGLWTLLYKLKHRGKDALSSDAASLSAAPESPPIETTGETGSL